MAIVSVQERVRPNGSNGTEGSNFDRIFLVESDSILDGPMAAIYAVGVPQLYSAYSYNFEVNGFSIVKNVEAEPLGKSFDCRFFWDVTCSYEPSDEEEKDPLALPPVISLDFVARDELIKGAFTSSSTGDLDDAIKATNGEPFLQQPTFTVYDVTLTIQRRENINYDVGSLVRMYNNKVNSTTVAGWGFLPRTSLLNVKVAREFKETEGVLASWLNVGYVMSYRVIGYELELFDHGSFHLVGGVETPFIDVAGNPFLGKLNGVDGQISTVAKFIKLQPYQEVDFNLLNLPTGFT